MTHFQTVSACSGWRGRCHCCGPRVPGPAARVLVTGVLVITAVVVGLSAAVGAPPVSILSPVVQHFITLLAGNLPRKSIGSQYCHSTLAEFGTLVQKSTYKAIDIARMVHTKCRAEFYHHRIDADTWGKVRSCCSAMCTNSSYLAHFSPFKTFKVPGWVVMILNVVFSFDYW